MDRPNILLVHTDQQRWDAVGANGNPEVHTPNMDRIANAGVTFDRYFVQAPVCMPSRASYLTGQYPSQLGIYANGVPLPEDAETLPRMLAGAGYTSASVGKLHFKTHANRDYRTRHPDYGFDHLEVSDEPGTYEDDYRAWVKRTAPDALDDVSWGPSPAYAEWLDLMGIDDGVSHLDEQPRAAVPTPVDADLTHSAFVAEQSIEFVEDHADGGPFLCAAGFYPPHSVPRADHPWMAPQEFLDLYDPDELTLPEFPPEVEAERAGTAFDDETLRSAVHGYYAMVSHVDHHVGRLLDCLDEQGIADETVVIFTSDHGEYLGEHLKYGKGFPGEDAASRVPFLVRWPDGIESPGRTEHAVVEAVDLVPTILDAAGVQVPPHLRGDSLLPALRGEDVEGHGSALIEGVSTQSSDGTVGRALRTDRYHYVMAPDGTESLYDLDAEFGKYRDVSDDDAYADALAELRRRLLVRINAAGAPEPRTWLY